MRGQGITEAIYTAKEIAMLKGIDREALKAIQSVKEVFETSKLDNVDPEDRG